MTTIDLKEDKFEINGIEFHFPIQIIELQKAFGNGNRRTKKKHNTIFTWDELGVLAYSKNGKMVESLLLEYDGRDFDFSPSNSFQGQINIDNEEAVRYHQANKDKRVKLFDGDSTGGIVLNGISIWFDIDSKSKNVEAIEISAFRKPVIEKIQHDKYLIKELDEEEIHFKDFGFKLSIIQELMYEKELLLPKFDLHEFVIWYDKREIDLEEEGYDPIDEVTQYFKDLPVPKRLANEITEIYQDGGNDIYLNLIRFAEGWEEYWDLESAEDAHQFPNLKSVVLCYAKENVLVELKQMGIKAEWL